MSTEVVITEAEQKTRLIVNIYSHHFSVEKPYDRDKKMMIDFCRPLGQHGPKRVGPGKFIRAIIRVFAVATADRSEFRFHISQLEDFYTHCRNYGVTEKNIEKRVHELHVPKDINLKHIDERTPRDNQKPIIDYIVAPGKMKIVEMDTGGGKTFIALTAMGMIKHRTFFCIKAQYIDKWVGDIHEAYDVKPGELMVVKGSKNLKNLLELGMADELEAKIILCSNTTFSMYLKAYELHKENIVHYGYPVPPHEMWDLLRVGLKVVDESHEFLHFNYKMTLYTHVHKTLDLSGTLIHDDSFIKKVLEILHPPRVRYQQKKRSAHSRAEALFYSIEDVDNRVKYKNPALKAYSHTKFEKSMTKSKKLTDSYISMVLDIVKKTFYKNREPGQKMAVYFGTKDLCTRVWEIADDYFDELNVVRYIGEDEYDDMLEGDLIITTLKSLGTAIDIPGLRYILMTDALGSLQLNIQVLGRLRPLKDFPGTDPVFMYLVCSDIPKHLDYHNRKKESFRNRVISHKEIQTGYRL